MGERLSQALGANFLKGAAAAAAIGSVALPSVAEGQSQKEYDFTGYKVQGPTATFGPPAEGSGQTADGGTDARPCIAIRNDSTLDQNFLVEVLYRRVWHKAVLPHRESIICNKKSAASARRIAGSLSQGKVTP